MPIIYKPVESNLEHLQGRRIAFCTTTRIATEEGRLGSIATAWWTPSYCHPGSQTHYPLQREDLSRFPWNCVTTVYISHHDECIHLNFDGRIVCIRSNYGVDRVARIYMTGVTDEFTEPLQARIRRMLHKKRVELCTAAAMVLHRRLGDRSAMHVLSCQLMGLIASFI